MSHEHQTGEWPVSSARNPSFSFTIDTLTDGSEYTGQVATLFLSIYRKHASVISCDLTNGDEASSHLVARYAIAGCGGDLLSRASADQRYKLGLVRAVFCSSPCIPENICHELSSLPGLLYATQKAGTADLTVVGAYPATRVENLIRLVHGNHQYPVVRVCQVPPFDQEIKWWMVYHDENIIVHARYVACTTDPSADDSSILLYLYSFLTMLPLNGNHVASERSGNSILILPEQMSMNTRSSVLDFYSHKTLHMNNEHNLPILRDTQQRRNGNDVEIEHIASLIAVLSIQPETSISRTSGLLSSGNRLTFVTPSARKGTIDVGLLVRAQQESCQWREHCTPDLRNHFPFRSEGKMDFPIDRFYKTTAITFVRSGGSFVFEFDRDFSIQVQSVNRMQGLQRYIVDEKCGQPLFDKEYRSSWYDQLKNFLIASKDSKVQAVLVDTHKDDAEISLDDEDSESINENDNVQNQNQIRGPSLLVLGTGCASPSPYRGASGYALLLPPVSHPESLSRDRDSDSMQSHGELVVVMEAGEGFCTQWNRHAEGRPLSTIKLIWISHAHWDHYGGLANLLYEIKQEMKGHKANLETMRSKRVRRSEESLQASHPPFVMAPPKVTKYLELLFDEPQQYFRGIQLSDSLMMEKAFASLNSSQPSGIFAFWENVPVEHSCNHAYGCIFGLRYGKSGDPPFIVCFSGDTLPSERLVRSCRELSARHHGRVDFLLHEATFEEAEALMSKNKKHSTVQEALQIGRDTNASRIMLTHFSQRYKGIPKTDVKGRLEPEGMKVGFALDGLLVPLFNLS